ncbi:unnamed protein product [Aureobasidium pullulans]|nr:unnamed protein product [Aureobasidium pullulans]
MTELESSTGHADISRATNIVRNFYNYLLHHNVCPEFTDQIHAARKICDLADVELFNVIVVSERLPGSFNTAVSATHGGTVAGVYSDDQGWEDVGKIDRTLQHCRDTVKFALSAYGSQEQYERVADVEKFETVYKEQISLELHCRRWTYPLAPTFSHSEEAIKRQQTEHSMVLWIEDDILQYCSVGMKIEGEVRELDIGIKWLDSVRAISPSFFEWLPNELYRKQKALKNEEEAQQTNDQVNLEGSDGSSEMTGSQIEDA